MNDIFINKTKEWNIELSDHQIRSLDRYYKLLIEWNEKINLTAITDYDEVIIKHFLDSLSIVIAIDINKVDSMIDVGTGAGFPGLVLKIAFPHLKVTLLDSLSKRVTFLNSVIDEFNLKDIKVIHGRAENVSREINMRESFDLCVSRAVARLNVLSELCTPFVRIGGRFISYKSGDSVQEVKEAEKAIEILGCTLKAVIDFPLYDNNRSFVVIDKVEAVPDKYPRREGIPSKKPLC